MKAIEALSEDLHENGSALVANLDLVLKWLTLRFFDTNPSVILKGLEYLTMVFQYLTECDYTMAEYEANCFIPYLILKVIFLITNNDVKKLSMIKIAVLSVPGFPGSVPYLLCFN